MRSLAVIPFALCTGAAAPALADWGGVAVNNATGFYGYSVRWRSASEAGSRAMGFCEEFSQGQPGCEVVLTTSACAGIVRGYKGFAPIFFVAEAATQDAAETQAQADCAAEAGSTCQFVRKFCAADN